MTHLWKILPVPSPDFAPKFRRESLFDLMTRPDLSHPLDRAAMGARMRGNLHPASLSRLLRRAAADMELDLEISGPEVNLTPEARRFARRLVSTLACPARGQSVVLGWHFVSDGLRLEWQARPAIPEQARNSQDMMQGHTFIPMAYVTFDQTRPRVLVVEDSPLIAMDLADILVTEGSGEVVVATSVEEAREALAGPRFDIVLLDVSLGRECSDVLLSDMREAWVVVVSGHLAETLPPSFAGLPFLGKPFQSGDVREMLLNWSDSRA